MYLERDLKEISWVLAEEAKGYLKSAKLLVERVREACWNIAECYKYQKEAEKSGKKEVKEQ